MSIIEKDMSDSDIQFKKKYLKYKKKYQILKEQQGQGYVCDFWTYFYCFEDDYTGAKYNGNSITKTIVSKLTGGLTTYKKDFIVKEDPFDPSKDFASLDAFKKKVVYKAYELSSYGTISRLGLSYYGPTSIFTKKSQITQKSDLYLGMFNFLNATTTGKRDIGAPINLNNLNLEDPVSIKTINDLFLSRLNYYPSNDKKTKLEKDCEILPKTRIRVKRIVAFKNYDLFKKYKVSYVGDSSLPDTIEEDKIGKASQDAYENNRLSIKLKWDDPKNITDPEYENTPDRPGQYDEPDSSRNRSGQSGQDPDGNRSGQSGQESSKNRLGQSRQDRDGYRSSQSGQESSRNRLGQSRQDRDGYRSSQSGQDSYGNRSNQDSYRSDRNSYDSQSRGNSQRRDSIDSTY